MAIRKGEWKQDEERKKKGAGRIKSRRRDWAFKALENVL